MRLRLLHDNVLILIDADHACGTDGASVIAAPEVHAWKNLWATVIGVGPGRWRAGSATERHPTTLRKGDRVLYPATSGQVLFESGRELRIMPEPELLAYDEAIRGEHASAA